MKRIALFVALVATFVTSAQENQKATPQISISGEGKIKVIPDIAVIHLGVQNSGKDPKEVKTQNDNTIEKVIQYIKKLNIPSKDYQTTQMSLYKNYDYEKKKHTYTAEQTVSITLNDITKYNAFMMDIMETGINQINGVVFKSSKMEFHEAEARKNAVLNAKKKADDYVSVLPGQKVGKALFISEDVFTHYSEPRMYAMNKSETVADVALPETPRETLALGELNITSTVKVVFVLE